MSPNQTDYIASFCSLFPPSTHARLCRIINRENGQFLDVSAMNNWSWNAKSDSPPAVICSPEATAQVPYWIIVPYAGGQAIMPVPPYESLKDPNVHQQLKYLTSTPVSGDLGSATLGQFPTAWSVMPTERCPGQPLTPGFSVPPQVQESWTAIIFSAHPMHNGYSHILQSNQQRTVNTYQYGDRLGVFWHIQILQRSDTQLPSGTDSSKPASHLMLVQPGPLPEFPLNPCCPKSKDSPPTPNIDMDGLARFCSLFNFPSARLCRIINRRAGTLLDLADNSWVAEGNTIPKVVCNEESIDRVVPYWIITPCAGGHAIIPVPRSFKGIEKKHASQAVRFLTMSSWHDNETVTLSPFPGAWNIIPSDRCRDLNFDRRKSYSVPPEAESWTGVITWGHNIRGYPRALDLWAGEPNAKQKVLTRNYDSPSGDRSHHWDIQLLPPFKFETHSTVPRINAKQDDSTTAPQSKAGDSGGDQAAD